MTRKPRVSYEFGPYRLDETERRLLRDGSDVLLRENGKEDRLPPKAFDLLLTLVKESGHMVPREELIEKLWPGTYVEDNRLSDNISTIRKFLGDRARNPLYIETVTKHGYRFVAEVREVTENDVEMLLAESTRAHIVIEEDVPDEPPPVSSPSRVEEVGHVLPAERQQKSRWPIMVVVACAALAVFATVFYFTRRPTAAPDQPMQLKSIAVLPFKPLGSSVDDDYLGLGMADALITKLSNVRRVVVRPTSAVLKYSNTTQDLISVGREQRVDALLDGRVQRAGDRVRVTVQLVRAADGAPIWADAFDEKFTNVFAIQDAIAERVAQALALQLTGEEKQGLARRYTESVEAYQLYLKGHHHWSTFQQADLLTSINYYTEALKKDPNYALAYSGIANAYTVIGIYGPLGAGEVMPKAREAAQRAVDLDGNLSEAHIALAAVKIFYDWDWQGAERELKRAMELNPNQADAHNLYGYYLHAAGKADEAMIEFKRATELAPQWIVPENDLIESYIQSRRYDEAITRCLEIIRIESDHARAYHVLGAALTEKGEFTKAIAALQRGVEISDDNGRPKVLAQLAYTYAVSGRSGDALKIVANLKEKPNSWLPFHLAMIYAGLGDKEQALAWLEKGADGRFAFLYDIRLLPQFDSLRSESRYEALLRRMNLEL